MADISGTNATETLIGTAIADILRGQGGSDRISGLEGGDTISGGDDADFLSGGDGNDLIYGHNTADLRASSSRISATLLANVGTAAVFVTGAPGDAGFVYALRKDVGDTVRINTATGVQSTFLDIPTTQFSGDGERGVLGLAFPPCYQANGRFFVYLTDPAGNIELSEYQRLAGSPPSANAGAFKSILAVPHPNFNNHNGGSLAFGPDGNLYVAIGDAGGVNDPAGNDSFIITGAPSAATDVDTIVDFNVTADTIRLDGAVMRGLGSPGAISAAKFWKSLDGVAHDPDDRIAYDVDSGNLFHDSNGSGAGGATLFARLTPNLALTDFVVI